MRLMADYFLPTDFQQLASESLLQRLLLKTKEAINKMGDLTLEKRDDGCMVCDDSILDSSGLCKSILNISY